MPTLPGRPSSRPPVAQPPHRPLGPSRPGSSPMERHQAQATLRYHNQLRVSELLPISYRPYTAQPDEALAVQNHHAARARQQYAVCLSNARTRQQQEARRWAEVQAAAQRPTQPTAVMGQGERRSPQELAIREQQLALAAARHKYEENVALISGEYTPLTLYDPVIHQTASAGLTVMGGVAVGATVPSLFRWSGAGASFASLRTAPQAFLHAGLYRAGFDATGQYLGARIFGGQELFNIGWARSFGEINVFQTLAAGANLNPYFSSVGTGAFALSYNNGFQSIFYSEGDPRALSRTKFATQLAAGFLLTKAGSVFESKMEQNLFVTRTLYQGALRVGLPATTRWAVASWGETYLPPLTNSVVGSVTGAAVGFGTDKLTAPDSTAKPTPTHPDSPLFLK